MGVERRGRLTRNVHVDQPAPWSWEEVGDEQAKAEEKSFAISKSMVWEAWRQVRAQQGCAGVDGQALEEFEADLAGNLYKLWNVRNEC